MVRGRSVGPVTAGGGVAAVGAAGTAARGRSAVSVRHSPPDTTSLLPWAKEEVFSFVLYYKQRTGKAARQEAGAWTRAMIDAALRFGGRYYLPYQLHATRAQFEQAYPEAAALRSLKRQVDPDGRFSNSLWARYL